MTRKSASTLLAASRHPRSRAPAGDQVVALIEAHRQAHTAHLAAIDADKQHEADRAGRRLNALAMDLLNSRPTTIVGVAALLRYGFEYVEQGFEWPNFRGGRAFDWSAALNKTAADALDHLTRVGTARSPSRERVAA